MGTAFGSIRIQLNADSSKLKKGVDESVSVLKGLRSQLGSINTVLAGFVGAKVFGAIGGAIFDVAKSASNLKESINAAGAVFGPFASIITSAADDMARKFGIVRSEFIASTTSLGSIFKATGLGADEAARMSVEFVKLATDLSSLKNLTFEESLDKIRAGLVGEIEPLRTVGVLLDEDTLKREAAAQGIKKQVKEMSAAEKLMLRAAVITKSLSDANGDLANTAGEFANALRGAQGRIENLKADIGGAFDDVSKFLTVGVGRALEAVTAGVEGQKDAWSAWARASVQEGGVVAQTIGLIGVGVAKVIDLFRLWAKGIAAVTMGMIGLGMGLEKLGIITTIDPNGSIEDFARAFAKSAADLDANLANASASAQKFFDDIKKGAQAAGAAADDLAGKAKRIQWDPIPPKAAGAAGAAILQGAAMGGAVAGAGGAAIGQVVGDMGKVAFKKPREAGDLFAGAALRGSTEARSAILQARGKADPSKKIEKNTGDTVRQLEQANQHLANVAKGIGDVAGEMIF